MMATPNPAQTQRLVHYGQAVAAAAWGRKTAIYTEAAQELGLSVQTVIRKIGEVTAKTAAPRKRRTDAGTSALTKAEAARIAAILPLPKKREAISPSGFTRRYGNMIAARIGQVRRDGLDACIYK